MEFALSRNFLEKLLSLKKSFNEKTGIDIDNAPPPYRILTFIGAATDVETRAPQINFLEGLCKFFIKHYYLTEDFAPINEITDIEKQLHDQQLRLDALRCLLTACLFIRDNTSTLSRLKVLINEAMGITDNNSLDKETLSQCYKSTALFLKNGEVYRQFNAFLAANKLPTISIDMYQEFIKYTEEQANLKIFANFPITNIVYPLLVNPLMCAGAAAGFMTGEILARSTSAMKANYQLTALLSGGLTLTMGPSGLFLLGPIFIENFIQKYLAIAIAWSLSMAGAALGAALAYGIGGSLDATVKIISKTGSYVYKSVYGLGPEDKPCGMSLIDGQWIENGVKMQLMPIEEIENREKIEIIIETKPEAKPSNTEALQENIPMLTYGGM